MKWYKIKKALVNLERVTDIQIEGKTIYFNTELKEYESDFVKGFIETFETKEEAEHRFKLIASILEDQFFQNN